MSRGSRTRSSVIGISSASLLVALALVAPAPAAAALPMTGTRPVAPVIGTGTKTVRLAAPGKVARAARRLANMARKRRPLPKRQTYYGPWRTALCSWYGEPQPLAGGGYLKPGMMIVAHKTLPFGTRIQFTYRGRTCVAVVKDRGPYVGGREFDLGPGTAAALHFDGVDQVSYRIVY